MKKIIVGGLICFLVIVTFKAQAIKVKGYYIDNNNNKIEVTFKMPIISVYTMNPDYAAIQKKIKCKDINKNKIFLTPSKAKEIVLYHNKEEIHMISKNISANKKLFLKQLEHGKINLYAFYRRQFIPIPSAGFGAIGAGLTVLPTQTKKMFIEKQENVLIKVKNKSFKTSAKEWFSDCSSIIRKIEEETYKKKHTRQAVIEYNKKCQREYEPY